MKHIFLSIAFLVCIPVYSFAQCTVVTAQQVGVVADALEDEIPINTTITLCMIAEQTVTVGNFTTTLDVTGTISLSNNTPYPYQIFSRDIATNITDEITFANPEEIVGGEVYELTIISGPTPGEGEVTITLTSPIPNVDMRTLTVIDPPMPVTWTSPLTYRSTGKRIELNWSVADQVDVAGYELERNDGNGFSTVQRISTIEAGSAEITYSAEESMPLTDTYYRIRQMDFDGAYSFSNILKVSGEGVTDLRIFPNPATDNVRFVAGSQVQSYRLRSATGQIILEQAADTQAGRIDLSAQAPGLYLLEFTQADGTVAQRKLVKR